MNSKSLPRLFSIGLMIAIWMLSTGSARAADITLPFCNVTPGAEAKIPAEEAGVLIQVEAKDGNELTAGALIAKIDDREAVFKREAARFGWQAATERATSEIEVKYAKAASLVAQAAYDKMMAANRGTPNAVTAIEILKAKLEWETALLQIEKAKKDQSIAAHDMGAKQAEYELGEFVVKRRAILAPFNGVVVDLFRHQNEWVNPGDPIAYLMKLDSMRVEQDVEQSKHDPQEIIGCRVTVVVELAGGRKEQFTGRVTYVSPVLKGISEQLSYLVRAEVENRREAGLWILRPNHQPTMTIHLGTNKSGVPEIGRRDSK